MSQKKIDIKHTSCKPNYGERGENLIYFIKYFLKDFEKGSASQIIINVVKNDNILAEALLENGFVRKREERLTNQYQKRL